MKREIIQFTTEEAWLKERINDLTSSDIPCLFGCGYQSYEELILCKRNKSTSAITTDERMQWGNALQDAIANEFAIQNNWTIRKKTEYIRIPEIRIGSSFDYEIIEESEDDKCEAYADNAILEIKNVDQFQYKKEWHQGFQIEATPYIELQIQHQLLISGLNKGYIGALIGGNQGVILPREANKKIHDAILIKAEKFWKEVDK